MKKFIAKDQALIKKQKRIMLFLIIISLIAIIFGICFIFFINTNDKLLVKEELMSFFTSISLNNKIEYLKSLFNSLKLNIIYIIFIWLLGISIIGIPLVILLFFIKNFILGFSISSIIYTYQFKGILGAFLYIFPHHILFILTLLVLAYFSLSFSLKLIKYFFLKENINFSAYFNKYLKILLITTILGIISSLLEVFLSPVLLKLFTKIL